jgi:asparagine synthase (glutamine-hydrolysing)
MCGLVGFWQSSRFEAQSARKVAGDMADTLVHRGPDDQGIWADDAAGLVLGHRRLSIVDLSSAGHQPMISESGRFVIAFNGEIYNHQDIRASLEAAGRLAGWCGHSDTETLLAAIELRGLKEAVRECVGMFAFALWDRKERTLSLVRDRMGEKPLYFGWQGSGSTSTLLFGSELKALRKHPDFEARIDRGALALFLRHNYIPCPYTIYEGFSKVVPGSIVTFREGARQPFVEKYWDTLDVAVEGIRNPFKGSPEDAVVALETLMGRAVAGQMVADVPLGAFLSGGIDSSTIVALMQKQSSQPIRTFTIGFHEKGFNEAEHAKAVASHLGTRHTELYVTAEQAMEVIPKLPRLYDEPFSDSSQIPTHLVSCLARREVTVALSGDAGDELFGGYTRYTFAARTWGRISRIPAFARSAAARAMTSISPAAWDRIMAVLPENELSRNAGDRIHKGADVIGCRSLTELYYKLVSHWHDPGAVVIGGREPPTTLTSWSERLSGLNDVERMMALDAVTYLPDDILVKVDRAAMGVSLETRVPLLDHRIVEFAWSLPIDLKVREGTGKWILREVLARHVPAKLFERKKMGFGIPIDSWLRGPLRDWAEDLLSESRLKADGLFEVAQVREKWEEHQSGRRNWQYHLWDLLMFQAWKQAGNIRV